MNTRAAVLTALQQHHSALSLRWGLKSIALFGSAARDEMRADSDVDVLVDFQAPPGFAQYFGLKDELESLFRRRVDLVTVSGLKPRARESVQRDLLRVA
jgi:uncharacterized protein